MVEENGTREQLQDQQARIAKFNTEITKNSTSIPPWLLKLHALDHRPHSLKHPSGTVSKDDRFKQSKQYDESNEMLTIVAVLLQFLLLLLFFAVRHAQRREGK